MDRNTVIGFVLIFGLMLAWMYTTMPSQEELERQRQERMARDTIPELEERDDVRIREEREPE
ncbi:MAG: membrane protein insertase YidC, partial [Bacteroidota bacterium]